MRLVFLASRPQPDRALHQVLVRLARELGSRHEVEIWVSQPAEAPQGAWPPDLEVRDLGSATDAGGGPSRLVHPRWEKGFTRATDAALGEALSECRSDVVVSTSPGTLAAAATLLPSASTLVHLERDRASSRDVVAELLRAHGHRVAAIVAPHPSVIERLVGAVGPLLPPAVVVPDPVSSAVPPRATGTSRVVVAVGRMRHAMDLGYLVRGFALAADALPGWRLRVLGDGGFRPTVLAQARKAGLYDRFEAPGRAADMSAEWARAGIAVSTTKGPLPLVVPEAMAAGVPVVAHRHPDGASTLVTHGVHGLLVGPRSVAAMAQALRDLGGDPELRRAMGSAGVEATRHLAPGEVADRWQELLAGLLAGSGSGQLAAQTMGQPPGQTRGQTTGSPEHRTAVDDRPQLLPRDARALVLGAVVDLTRSVTDRWMVLRGVGLDAPRVVVPAAARLDWLAAAEHTSDLLHAVDPDQPERGPVRLADTAQRLRRDQPAVVSVSTPPVRGGRPALDAPFSRVDVEFWEPSSGGLVPPRPNEWVGRWTPDCPLDEVDLEGTVVRTPAWTVAPTVSEVTGPIDVVYTWVDGADRAWAARRDAKLAEMEGLSVSRTASGRARFTSRDELRYSLRSLHMFAPWVRRIFLVTDRQVPAWLAPDHPRVSVVDHRDVLPSEALPTFNSHAIETGLHLVDGLAERFVYLNDDVMLGRPLGPEVFFQPNGLFAAFVSEQILGEDDPEGAAFRVAGMNNRRLLQREYGRTITRVLRHAPHPFTRTAFAEAVTRFADEVAATRAAPFRSETDVSVASSLVQHDALVSGRAYEGRTLDIAYIGLTDELVETAFARALASRDADVICVADHHDWAVPEVVVERALRDFLEAYFPIRAPWELPSS